MSERVFVEAPARLHFGVLDLRGDLGRRFGGIGAAVPAPSLLLEARPATELQAEGPDAARALEFARRFARHHGLDLRLHLCLHRSIPAHAGLGSGTQLGLAVARASAELSGLPTDVASLARAVDRGRRAGEDEAAAFARLPPPSAREVERVSHLVLMQLLPALAEADLAGFGAALGEVQRITGGWFASAQGGVFAPGVTGELVERLRAWGAVGVGQSSWGPALYGIAGDPGASRALAERVRAAVGAGGLVYEGGFSVGGARVWREGSAVSGPKGGTSPGD